MQANPQPLLDCLCGVERDIIQYLLDRNALYFRAEVSITKLCTEIERNYRTVKGKFDSLRKRGIIDYRGGRGIPYEVAIVSVEERKPNLDPRIKQKLLRLLSGSEAAVLEFLLSKDLEQKLSIAKISDETQYSYVQVYRILPSLRELGVIDYEDGGNEKQFRVTATDETLRKINDREKS